MQFLNSLFNGFCFGLGMIFAAALLKALWGMSFC